MNPTFVSRHIFLPLIHYTKVEIRYKKCSTTGERTISTKQRPIKYASHRDACVMAYYSHQINQILDARYKITGIGDSVIAYRSLGQTNYNFAAEALAFAQEKAPAAIWAFDVTGFFDNLDHGLLKKRLKALLGVTKLADDWHKVFRSITRFHFIDLAELRAHPTFGPRIKKRSHDRIAAV